MSATLKIAQVNLALLSLARTLNSLNFGYARHSSSKLDSALTCTNFPVVFFLVPLGAFHVSAF